MEGRIRTSDTEATRPDRDAAHAASPRAVAEALREAHERIALLERRELALRAALAAAGVDAEALLNRLELGAPHPVRAESAAVEPVATAAVPMHVPAAVPVLGIDSLPTAAARGLARRLADEVIAGPATLRLRAAQRLVEVAGAAAAPALAAAVDEAEGASRAALIEQLGKTGSAEAFAVARRSLSDDASEVRAAAVEACARLGSGEELLEAIRVGLGDADARVRRRSALCAASARGIDPGLLLVPLLSDGDRQVRRVACTALSGTREPVAALALIGALLDDDASVRGAAGAAAERLFGQEAAGIAAMPQRQRQHAVARLRAHVASNLVRLAPGGKLPGGDEAPAVVARVGEAVVENVLEDLLSTGHPGAGFEDDVAGWTEENDPELQASFARIAGGWSPWDEAEQGLEAEAERIYREADEAGWGAAGVEAEDAPEVAADAAVDSAEIEESVEVVAEAEAVAQIEAVAEVEARPELDSADIEKADEAALDAAELVVSAEALDLAATETDDVALLAEALELGEAEVVEPAASDDSAEARVAHPGDVETPTDDSAEASAPSAVEAVEQAQAPAIAEEVTDSVVPAEAPAAPESEEAVLGAEDVGAELEGDGVASDAEVPAGPDFETIESVLRAALRGCTDEALAEELGLSETELEPIVNAHIEAGRLVRRGRKLFLP